MEALMHKGLFILSVLVFLFAIFASIEVTTSFQHVVAGVAYVCAAILFAGAAIVRAVNKLRDEIKKQG
jgi:hypothetical protein